MSHYTKMRRRGVSHGNALVRHPEFRDTSNAVESDPPVEPCRFRDQPGHLYRMLRATVFMPFDICADECAARLEDDRRTTAGDEWTDQQEGLADEYEQRQGLPIYRYID